MKKNPNIYTNHTKQQIKEQVLVYIKIVIKKENYTVIISFHEPEKNIKKLFI